MFFYPPKPGGLLFDGGSFADKLSSSVGHESSIGLEEGSKIAVIGGGPAGSFVSYFLLDMARMMGTDLVLDIFEPRDF